ncbi:MAG: hypothetical protein V4543_01785 [Bacteroidota bacterium]
MQTLLQNTYKIVKALKSVALSVIIVSGFYISGYAQSELPATNAKSKADKLSKALLKTSEKQFRKHDYYSASRGYASLLERDPRNPYLLLKQGVSLLYCSQATEGLSNIEKAHSIDSKVSPDYYYWHGRACQLTGKLDSALNSYRQYLGESQHPSYKQEAKDYIEETHRAKFYASQTGNAPMIIDNMGPNINSQYAETNPILSADGNMLIFTSRRQLAKEESLQGDGEYCEKVMYALRNEDNTWGKARPLQAVPARRHVRCVALYHNDSKLLIYDESQGGTLMVSEWVNDNWTEPYNYTAAALQPKWFEESASLNADHNKIVISRQSGRSNYDLLISHENTDGTWSKPKRLPRNINTKGDEVSPWLSPDGLTLYYACKGHNGQGGFDLFKTNYDVVNEKWGDPTNLGSPANSSGDDYSYTEVTTQAKERIISVATERAGGFGKSDIYEVVPVERMVIAGTVSNYDGSPLPEVKVIVTGITTGRQLSGVTNADGKYLIKRIIPDKMYQVVIVNNINREDTLHATIILNAHLPGRTHRLDHDFLLTPHEGSAPTNSTIGTATGGTEAEPIIQQGKE